jgi:hypothetical protein
MVKVNLAETERSRQIDKPGTSRGCTDIICLLLFVIFIGVQVALSVIVYLNGGDPNNLLKPRDSDGRMCDEPTPNLFFFDLVSCLNINAFVTGCPSRTVCVKQCPPVNYFYLLDSHRSELLGNYCDQRRLLQRFNGTLPPTPLSVQSYMNLVDDKICPMYTFSSAAVFGRCMPSFMNALGEAAKNLVATDSATNESLIIRDQNQTITDQLIVNSAKYITDLLNLKTTAQFVLEDFVNAAVIIAVLLAIAAVASFIYIIIMRWILGKSMHSYFA